MLQGLTIDGEKQTDDYRPTSPVVRPASPQGASQSPPSIHVTYEEVPLLPPDDPPSWLQDMFD